MSDPLHLFVSPVVPATPRGRDDYGSGWWRSPRTHSGHQYRHPGIDLAVEPGQVVRSPILGRLSHIGWAYEGDDRYHALVVTGRWWRVRLLYVAPAVAVGQMLAPGDLVGHAEDLRERYPGGGGRDPITPHVHFEVIPVEAARLTGRFPTGAGPSVRIAPEALVTLGGKG